LVEEAKQRLTAAREQAAGARSASTPPNRG
jgi:hypothetical protein